MIQVLTKIIKAAMGSRYAAKNIFPFFSTKGLTLWVNKQDVYF